MSSQSWFKSLHVTTQAAIVAGCATVLAAIVAGLLTLLNTVVGAPKGSPSSSGSPSSPATSATVSRCTARLRIISPAEGTRISGSAGVLIKGQACGLSNEDGWLFDFDYNDHYYHEDYSQNPGPIAARNGNWSFLDQPVGSKGDKGIPYSITLVLANQQCNATLASIKSVEGDLRVAKFPIGCQIVDNRNVYVTWP